MGKFSIGDTIIGNHRNKYGVTKKGIKHEVIEIEYAGSPYEDVKVRVLEGVNKGFVDWVASDKFDLVERANEVTKEKKTPNDKKGKKQQYTMNYDSNLQTTFVRVGDVTIAVPIEQKFVSVTVKHPEDVESDEIAKAVAYYRLAKGTK